MMNMRGRIAILVLCATLLPQGIFAQSTTRLSPSDDIAAAIQAAKPGAVIELVGGDYGALNLRGLSGAVDAPITLRSADPANPAIMTGLNLREVSHLVLDGLLFDYTFRVEDSPSLRPFQVFTTRDLVIENSTFDGDLADSDLPDQGAYPTGFGLAVRSSAQIRLENNEMRDFYRGFVIRDVVDLSVLNNDVHAIRMDGMNFAQVERVLIEGNTIHDFKRALNSIDHSDMIQFWTSQTERPSVDITIRNNVLNSGLGWYTQSIFMRNEMVDSGLAGKEMFYRNIVIEGNVIVNAQAHGITVGEADGLTIRNNTILHNPRSDAKPLKPRLRTPQVRVSKDALNVQIVNNVLPNIVGYENQSDWRVADNLIIQDSTDKQPNHYNTLFMAPQSGDPRDLGSFQYLAGGALAGAGIGAPMLEAGGLRPRPKSESALLAPIIRTLPDPNIPNRFSFDISQSAALLGLDLSAAQVDWAFGDGGVASGLSVSHDYARPGLFDARLIITLPGGQILETSAQVTSKRPEVIVFDVDKGIISSFATIPTVVLDLRLPPGPIQLGGDNALVRIPREAIAPFFGSRSFVLQTRVRSSGGYKAAGTVLHIAKSLVVTIGGRGTFDVEFNTDTSSMVKLRTPALKVLNGEWVDFSIEYSDAEALLTLRVNGQVVAQAESSGPMRPLEYWGLVLGHPFQPQKTFQGEMESLVLTVGTTGDLAQN
jgi:parallel beta-helix repeat protein